MRLRIGRQPDWWRAGADTPSAGNPDAPKETLPDDVIYPCPGSRTTPGGLLPPDVRAFSRFFADLESSAGIFRETVCSPDADPVHFAGRIVPPVGFAKLVSGRHLKSD